MENLKLIVDEAMAELAGLMPAGETERVARVIEAAVIRGAVEGQHRAVAVCHQFAEAEQDLAHKIARAIRQKNEALIANLSSLR